MDPSLSAQQMTRRLFLRASAVTLMAAPLLPYMPSLGGAWRFINNTEAETIVALCERIIPADRDPGAAWAGVVYFIDRKLGGYLHRYQHLYRLGIQGVNECSQLLFGKPFVGLTSSEQDELLRKLESSQAPGEIWKQVSATEFFNLLVDHTLQGFYGGPRHGGNRDAASWRMLGLPTAPVRSRRPLNAPWSTSTAPSPQKS
jgi:gluconate 2-dehydrogenase gamma chain